MRTDPRIRQAIRDWVPITLLDMLKFSGRSRRWEAAGYTLLITVCARIPVLIAGDRTNPLLVFVGLCLGLVMTFPLFALFVRRMHDQNKPTLWVLLPTASAFLTGGLLMLPNAHSSLSVAFLIWENRPGWTGTSGILTFAALLAILVETTLLFSPGTPGPNRYGPDPRVAPQPSDNAATKPL